MALIDLHCHLDLYDDPHAVAAECERRGLYVFSVTTTPSAFEGTSALVSKTGRVKTGLGLHPELAARHAHELPLFERLLPSTDYVGEVGLDGSPPHKATLPQQQVVLEKILRLCSSAGGKKITLHSRSAAALVLDMLAAEPNAGSFILHWYLGSARQIERACDLGMWFSVGPAMLQSERGRAAVRAMPVDRILSETDGPFGQIDGQPLFPWEVALVLPQLADLWSKSEAEVQTQLNDNLKRFLANHDARRPPVL